MDKKQENIKKRFMQALALYKQGKINAAQIICDEILHDHPNEGHTLQLLGLIAITNRQFSEAVFHLKKSLTTLENNAICHHNLASAYNLTGEKEKAVKHYLRAIEIKPEYVEAYFNLIYIFDLKSNKNIIDPIKKLIHQTDLSNNDISLLHFAAGKYYHTIKNYSEAFQHIEQANHRQPSTFQPLKHHQIVDNIIQTFNKKLFEQCKSAGNDSDMPLFVIGMPTSGSNLLGKMLTSHPDIGTIGNNTDFYILAKELDQLRPGDLPYPQCITQLAPRNITSCATVYLNHLRSQPGYQYVTSSFSLNFIYLGLIKLLFPNAKFIQCQRDPLDACLASYFTLLQRYYEFSNELGHIIHFYQDYIKIMRHWEALFPKDIYSVPFEKLVKEPKKILQGALKFLNLPWNDNCIQDTSPGASYNFEVGFSKNYSPKLCQLKDATDFLH